jgi:hypothetical protein
LRAPTAGNRRQAPVERGEPRNTGPSAEGVDANASKNHLFDVAQSFEVRGRSTMTKSELIAIKKNNRWARGRWREINRRCWPVGLPWCG